MTTLILYTLLSTAMFYLGSRALITSWLWSRYSPRLATFMDCPACTAFWWGFFFARVIGWNAKLSFFELEPRTWITTIIAGLCTLVTTPMIGGLMQAGFDRLGSAVAPPDFGKFCTKNPKCRMIDGHADGCYLE